MKKLLLREAAKHKLQNRRRKRWQKTVSILACLVVFCTVYALILPALTAEADTYCGKEEHTHTEDCYEDKLICGKEEGQGAHHHTDDCYREVEALVCPTPESDGHQHTEVCYTEEQVLTCTNTDEGHVHSEFDSCYTTEKTLTCGMEEGQGAHHHTAECYETKKELICGQEENDGHRHIAECYEKELICGKEEHTHTLACYSNPNADVENGDVWQNTVSSVTLTGKWGADLAAIAQTQTGYTESTANYAVAEDGQTIHGYTRYGAWANDPYRDNWSAQFADFCLSYAGVPTSAVPQNSDCSAWNYTIPDGYTPKTGDLLLLDTDNSGNADHAGIVITADDSALTAIVGDADKAVRNNTYNIGSENIKGYVSIPENPALADDNNEEETTETTPAPEVTEEPQETPTPEATPEAESTQTPEITPEAEPTQVPEATPEAEPTQAPETTPDAELTPTPELSVTPIPTVDPELSVTPTPELSATPTPELSVTPTVTPEPDYQYEDDKVIVAAYADEDANLPEDAVLNARYIEPGSEEYQNAVAAFDEQLGNGEDAVADYVLYDVYFTSESAESENKEIEPEGNVNIFMTFKDNEHTKVQGDIVDTQVVHLKDSGEAEVIENGTVDVADDSTIQAITFTNSNFSITGARLLLAKAAGPTLEKNEWFGTLADAESKTLILNYDQSLVDLQNAQSDIWVTCYNNQQQEIGEIPSFNIRNNVSQFNRQTLQNAFNNALNNNPKFNEVAYVKLRWEIPSLSNTFFDFSNTGCDGSGNDIKFNIVKRIFKPDEEWTNDRGLTYVAIGPNHICRSSGSLGAANNFHIVGFTSVTTGTHTNGNIATPILYYNSNFGTNNMDGEISYIQHFMGGSAYTFGGTDSDKDNSNGKILIVGKNERVTVGDNGNSFYINGNKVNKPSTIWQDTENYSYLSIGSKKDDPINPQSMYSEIKNKSAEFASMSPGGAEINKQEKTITIHPEFNGTAVLNINASELNQLDEVKIIGLSNTSGVSLVVNVVPDSGITDITIPGVTLDSMDNSGGEVVDFSAGKVIWNITNMYGGSIQNTKKTSGTLLAPNAQFVTHANWNGAIFADTVDVQAESHRTDYTGSMGFGITKKLVQSDGSEAEWKSGYQFDFILTGNTNADGKKAPMPVGTDPITNSKTISASYGNQTPTFGNITYTTENGDAGNIYTYTLVEKTGTITGITYSQERYEICVVVDNQLQTSVSYKQENDSEWTSGLPTNGKFVFTNVYEPQKTHAVIEANKTVNGNNPAANETFSFRLEKYENNQWTELETIQNSGRYVAFGQQTYENTGTYYYKITEVGVNAGYEYDTSVHIVTVEVKMSTNNKLESTVKYYKYDKDDEIELNSLESNKTEIYALFNNLKKENYTLPETGGTGTNRFTAIGLALMAGSLMCGYVMRRKRREGRRN